MWGGEGGAVDGSRLSHFRTLAVCVCGYGVTRELISWRFLRNYCETAQVKSLSGWLPSCQ